MITVERSQRDPTDKPWWWIKGDTFPHRDVLKLVGARYSVKRKAWYFIGNELPDRIQQLVTPVDDAPCSDEEAAAILGIPIAPKPVVSLEQPAIPSQLPVEAEKRPAINILKPKALSIDLPSSFPTTTPHLSPKRGLSQIGQMYVGELTGSITSDVFCFGYAVHEGVCVYVNFGGPRMAVEAIRARFSKGEIVNLVPMDAPGMELTAGEGNTGMYTAYMQNIPEAKFTAVMLCHEWLTEPNYAGKSTTFIFRTSDDQAMLKLKHRITELVSIPIFDEWASYLYHAGQIAGLVRPTRSGGGIDLLAIDLDVDAWTRLITGGLSQERITLPY